MKKKNECTGFQVSRYEVYESVTGGNTVTSELRIYNVSREGARTLEYMDVPHSL